MNTSHAFPNTSWILYNHFQTPPGYFTSMSKPLPNTSQAFPTNCRLQFRNYNLYFQFNEPVTPVVPVFLFHFFKAQITFHVVRSVEQSMETIPESYHYWFIIFTIWEDWQLCHLTRTTLSLSSISDTKLVSQCHSVTQLYFLDIQYWWRPSPAPWPNRPSILVPDTTLLDLKVLRPCQWRLVNTARLSDCQMFYI